MKSSWEEGFVESEPPQSSDIQSQVPYKTLIRSLSLIVSVLGIAGIIGYVFDIPWLRSYVPSISPLMPLPTAVALCMLGIALMSVLTFQAGAAGRFVPLKLTWWVTVLVPLSFAVYYFALSLWVADFNGLSLLLTDYDIPVPFHSVINLLLCSLATLICLNWRHIEKLMVYGVGIPALLAVCLSLYALVGLLLDLPLLYNTAVSLPAVVAYLLTGITLLVATIRDKGLLYPLVSEIHRVRLLGYAALGLPLAVVIEGIINVIQLHHYYIESLNGAVTPVSLSELFLSMEVSNIGLAVLMGLVGLRAIYHYGESIKAARQQTALVHRLDGSRQELQLALDRFNVVSSATQDTIWDWDLITNQLIWNDAVQEMFKYPKEIIGPDIQWWYERIHPDDRERVMDGIHAAIDEGCETWVDEYRFLGGDGSVVTVLDRGYVIRNAQDQPVRMIGSMIDVTERKRMEEELQHSEERFRLLVNGVKDYSIYLVDRNGCISSWNQGAENLYGYNSMEILGEPLSKFLTEEEIRDGLVEREIQTALSSGRFETEGWRIRKDGSRFWANVVVTTLYNSRNEAIGFSNITRDITERKQAEEALRTSEENFKSMANSIPQLAWMTDETGWIFWYNQRWYDYTGTSLEEMQGWDWQTVHHPDHVERVVQRFKQSIESGEPWEDTFPLRGRNGEWRWFLSRALPVRNEEGHIVQWFGSNTDITEQLEVEAALKESEAQFRRLAQALPHLVWIIGPDGREHLYVNDHWIEYTGLDLEATNKRGWDVILHPEDRERTLDTWNQSFKTGQPYEVEYRLRSKNGEYNWFIGRGLPILDENSQAIRWFGTCTNIEPIKQAQAAAEDANRKKSQFLANMSHELRTPLNAVIGYSQMMEKGVAGDLNEKQRKYAHSIYVSGKHLLDMVNDILDLAKVEVGQIRLDIGLVDVHPLVRDLQDVLNNMAQDKGVDLLFHVEDSLTQVVADPARLKQIFFNLVSNAIKFNKPDGRVSVILSRAEEDGRAWFVGQVEDTGIGMPADKMGALFSEFYQIDSSLSRKYEGTGLGLALTKHLVELHGGTIRVNSVVGVGSCFAFRIPNTLALESEGVASTGGRDMAEVAKQ